ncbi:hypothetical protein [Flavobacterium humidisoli]|uniref:Uncharacterized protein n=1 Tax=Flavobacterium humidisoli TaxID=2937442 RepID=A0ABY4LWR6_9FLAO|nr:hypothetical protein [Flavobacterium humidisoli]UPZ17257.1 hypothetical protein M0M44_07875 [Flavobacterium humidisoli]
MKEKKKIEDRRQEAYSLLPYSLLIFFSPGSIPVKILFNPSVDKILDFRLKILDFSKSILFSLFLFSEKTDKNLQCE